MRPDPHHARRAMSLPALSATLLCLVVGTASAQDSIAGRLGLAGFGSETKAGLDGRVVRVTNLDARGPGSLQAALDEKGPRIVVFEVAGIIDLGKGNLDLREPFVTIAGQTAPSPGITLVRGGLDIRTHDVLMQHIRFRMGDAGEPKYTEPGFTQGWDVDATTQGKNAYNIVIDHCSFAWAVDENLSISGPRYDGPEGTSRRVTLSNNIIAEGLQRSVHSKREPHSKGTLVHDEVRDVAIIGNLYAHNDERSPLFKGGTTGVVANNLIYNPGRSIVRAGWWAPEWEGRSLPAPPRLTVVGNELIRGRDTRDTPFITTNGAGRTASKAEVYASDNITGGNYLLRPVQEIGPNVERLSAPPLWPANFKAVPAKDVREKVLGSAGARPQDRDSVDRRIVADVRNGAGRIIDSQEEVGGYPKAEPVRRKLDVPREDIAAWLKQLSDELVHPVSPSR
ncbi:MAG: hypothetical protein REI94_19735 [Moraxellaceae bacterium]|nr:hypothetical protein [Moraxellaceae bacterium]